MFEVFPILSFMYIIVDPTARAHLKPFVLNKSNQNQDLHEVPHPEASISHNFTHGFR